MRRTIPILAAGAALGFALAAATPAAAQTAASPTVAQVSIVHGLRGIVADISVDGNTVLKGFGAERSTDPLPVPAGPHKLEVRRSGDTGPPAISTTMDVPGGVNISLVAHLDPTDKPVLTPFVNEATAIAGGNGRLAIRNTSAAPTVQFLVDGQQLGAATAAGKQAAQDLATGDHTISVQSPDNAVLLGPQSVQVPAGAATAVYLIGSPKDSSLGWLVQTIKTGSAAPGGVPTGDSGLKDRGLRTTPAVLLIALAAAAAAAGAGRLRHRLS